MSDAWAPEEHLRRALVDLQEAQRAYIASFQRGDHARPDEVARSADAARQQAQVWGNLVRAAQKIDDEP